MATRFNSEYANLWKEVPLFLQFALRKSRPETIAGRILIVNTCLIGEFAASLPAIRAFIRAHPEATVDLLVAPSVKDLALRIKGVGKAYAAASVYGRDEDEACDTLPAAYDGIIALRMSRAARDALRHTRFDWIATGAPHFVRYGLHLLASLWTRRAPKQWRTLNFEMLGIAPEDIPFEDILSFTDEERARVRALEAFQSPGKAVIVHTSTHWPMKRWASERWVELLETLNKEGNIRFVFVGAREDEDSYREIADQLSFPTYSLIGQLTLSELTLALAEADYFIGIDSGPMNIAHLVDLPSVSILGPGPHMYLPTNPRDRVVDRSGGRGFSQMFFARKKGYIHEIEADDVRAEFMHIYRYAV